MNEKLKIFLATFLYILLLAGTVCGIVFGVKYKQRVDNSVSIQIVEELKAQLAELENSDVGELREALDNAETEIANLEHFLELKNAAIQTAYSQNSKLRKQIDDLNKQIADLRQLLVEKENEEQESLYEAYSTYPDLLGVDKSSSSVASVVYSYVQRGPEPEALNMANIYKPGEEISSLSAGTENNKSIIDFKLNKIFGSYLTVESSDSNVNLSYLIEVDTSFHEKVTEEGYFAKKTEVTEEGKLKVKSISNDNMILVDLNGYYEQDFELTVTVKLYDYKDRVVTSQEYTFAVQASPTTGFTGLTDEEVQSVATAVKGLNIGTVDSFNTYRINGETISLYFNGKSGDQENVIYQSKIAYQEGYTSTDICNVLNTTRPGSKMFVGLNQIMTVKDKLIQIDGKEVKLADVKISCKGKYDIILNQTTITATCLVLFEDTELEFEVTAVDTGEFTLETFNYALVKQAIIGYAN